MHSEKKAASFARRVYNKFNHQSLFAKYFTVFVGVMLICFVILGMTLGIFVSSFWTSQKKSLLIDNAKSVANTTSAILTSNSQGSVAIIASNLALISKAIDADIFITDISGNVIMCKDIISNNFAVSGNGACQIHNDITVPEEIINSAKTSSYFDTGTLGGSYFSKQLVAGEPVIVNGKVIAVVFAVAPTISGFKEYTAQVLKMFLFASLLSLSIGFIVIYFFTITLIRPLNEMSKATKAYSAGDFGPRVKVTGNDELAELVRAFNKMASDLSLLESSRRSFVANVSHELKTPMTTIGGFIDGILDGTIPQEKQSYYLEIVSDETKRLSRLVTAMLNMSKIEAGELKLNPKPFDVSAEVFNVLLSFEQIIEKKHIEVTELDKLKPISITADEDMLHQVIYNLIDNAVKFTENGQISVTVDTDNTNTIIRIRNTGSGISSEERSKIFERFYKVDKSRSYDVKGAGLGLYICKTIVEMHGGTIGCDSKDGEYTEFWFSVPNNLP